MFTIFLTSLFCRHKSDSGFYTEIVIFSLIDANLYQIQYLSRMKVFDKRNRDQERKKWAIVFLICIGTTFFYAQQSSKNTFAYQFFNPFYTWSNGEGNPIRNVVTKFIPQQIPDRLKELM